VLFAHVPLWTVYPEWGWGTDDSEAALALVKRFGSVTVLNGHIHQIMQKVEGHVSFHTALSTAFPQPAPGTAPSPGPMKVAPEKLRSVLGIADVTFVPGRGTLAIVDGTLSGEQPGWSWRRGSRMALAGARRSSGLTRSGSTTSSSPLPRLTVKPGTSVTWVNGDDVPHLIASADGHFQSSKVLDTGNRFTVSFPKPGTYSYFCSLHPKMQGQVVVMG
jgi:hypothetical protein